jgi:hypothetical protein
MKLGTATLIVTAVTLLLLGIIAYKLSAAEKKVSGITDNPVQSILALFKKKPPTSGTSLTAPGT